MNSIGMILTLVLCVSEMPQDASLPNVPRWQPHDFEFQSSASYENPFMTPFSATVTRPDGGQFTTHGFYDGEGTWKVRVAPNAEGNWSLTTHSDDPALDGKTASFVCVANDNESVHGGLQIDPDHPYHFIFEDGTRYFLMGYECDWLWALDMEGPEIPRLNPFLDKLAAHGFNHIILNAYAHDCGWRKGKTGDDDYGPPPMYAWHGSNEEPDHSRFNLAYWQHYDGMMDSLYRRGIIAHIMIKVYNKMVKWPARGSAEDDLYFRWLIARYAAYPNVVWDFSKEAHNEKDLDYKLSRFRLIRETDPYHRLITDHDDDRVYDSGAYDSALDFRSDQHHKNWHKKILQQREQNTWPVVNVEFGYEHGPKGIEDKTYGNVQPPEEFCRRAWEICLAGGYIAYYYTYTAWDVLRPEDTPTGYSYFRNLYEFFENTGYWLMKPADELVSEGHCLANPGQEYIVFLNNAAPFTLKLENLSQPLKAEWYHPFTGEKADAGMLSQGTSELTPPSTWGEVPVALHVGAMLIEGGVQMGKSDVHKQNKRLGRGVNIIGYDPLWKSRSRARMQDKHFRLIKEAGFDNVRIPLHPFRDSGIDGNNQITDDWFDALDWAVEQSLSNGLMVILDFHEFNTMGRDPISHKERFLATWEQISKRYKDCPGEVIFEILNEPNKELTPELWNQFYSEALAIIRRTNPTRTVIIGPGHWNGIGSLEQLELPENDRNIIVTVHYYSPMEFTHQGASWSSSRDKIGIEWNATSEEKQVIIKDFGKAQAWSEEHDRPLFLGEFGAYDKADMDSRVRYISFVTRHAEKLGWSWAYWQFDSDFVVYDIPNDKWVEPIRDALVPKQ